MTEACRLLEIDKIRTTSYKPSTNGALERVHRTLNTMLNKIVRENQRDWDTHVAYILAAYNTTEHSTTGYTPNMLRVRARATFSQRVDVYRLRRSRIGFGQLG